MLDLIKLDLQRVENEPFLFGYFFLVYFNSELIKYIITFSIFENLLLFPERWQDPSISCLDSISIISLWINEIIIDNVYVRKLFWGVLPVALDCNYKVGSRLTIVNTQKSINEASEGGIMDISIQRIHVIFSTCLRTKIICFFLSYPGSLLMTKKMKPEKFSFQRVSFPVSSLTRY